MIRIEDAGGLRRITLARPEKANSITGAMLPQLVAAVEGWSGAALVLTGAGRVFSAGGDIGEVRDGGLAGNPDWERLSGAVAASPALTVAALNGTAAGGALGMVLACDIRLAVPDAELFYPVLRMGVLPQPSDPQRLCRLVGPSRAAMLLLAGARISAREALGWGLLDRIVAAPDLLAAAERLCQPAMEAGPGRVAAIRVMIRG